MVANTTQLPQPIAALIEPSAPGWALRMLLKLQTHFQPIWPRQPTRLWLCNKADLPPALEWPGCLLVVPDQDCVAIAHAGVWRKISLGGPV